MLALFQKYRQSPIAPPAGYEVGIGLPCLTTEVFFQRSLEATLADNILATFGMYVPTYIPTILLLHCRDLESFRQIGVPTNHVNTDYQ